MKERLKELRKTLGLTQQEFADRLGISRGNIATYETREGAPGNSVVNLICREFNVNETWLRTGMGEMFVQKSRSQEIAEFVGKVLQGKEDNFKRRFIAMLSMPMYQPLKNKGFFALAKADGMCICWNNDVDLCPDTLYTGSRPAMTQ